MKDEEYNNNDVIKCSSIDCEKNRECKRWTPIENKAEWLLNSDECINGSKYGNLNGNFAFFLLKDKK